MAAGDGDRCRGLAAEGGLQRVAHPAGLNAYSYVIRARAIARFFEACAGWRACRSRRDALNVLTVNDDDHAGRHNCHAHHDDGAGSEEFGHLSPS